MYLHCNPFPFFSPSPLIFLSLLASHNTLAIIPFTFLYFLLSFLHHSSVPSSCNSTRIYHLSTRFSPHPPSLSLTIFFPRHILFPLISAVTRLLLLCLLLVLFPVPPPPSQRCSREAMHLSRNN